MLRRSMARFARVSNLPRASTTHARFMPRANARLLEATEKNQFSSKYWLTAAQARRSCNTTVKVGAQPTQICLEAEEVYHIKQLNREAAQRILEVNPPYFGNGVGILGRAGKWNLVQAKRLVSVLATGSDQELWVDKDYVEKHEIPLVGEGEEPTNIMEQSSVVMFNADQLEHPHRGEPQEGIALNISSGKRVPQPAHDILLAHGILRGYDSCFWLTKQQLDSYHVRAGAVHGIEAPTALGRLVPFHLLPQAFQDKVNNTLTFPTLHENHDVFYTLNVAGWERSRSSRVTNELTDVGLKSLHREWRDSYKRFFWVNIDELQTHCANQQEIDSIHEYVEKNVTEMADMAKISSRKFYNACMTSAPERCTTRFRSLHVFLGSLVGQKYASLLREEYATRGYSNPIWVNRSEAKRLGVGIKDSEIQNCVALEKEGTAIGDVYNLHDIKNWEEIVQRVPPPDSRAAPWCLLVKWMPVLGKQRQEKLRKQERDENLWISLSEIIMGGLELKEGAQPVQFGGESAAKKKKKEEAAAAAAAAAQAASEVDDEENMDGATPDGEEGGDDWRGLVAMSKEAFNAAQTTDVVRVIGKSKYYVRPQGGLSIH